MTYYPYHAAFFSDFIANSYYLHGHSYLMGKTCIVSLGRDHTSLMIQESEPEGDDQEAALSSGKNKVMLRMKSIFKAILNIELCPSGYF